MPLCRLHNVANQNRLRPGPRLETDDEVNEWLYTSNHERSVREVLEESHQVYQQLLAVIEGLPDDVRIERIEPVYRVVWVNDQRFAPGEFFHHFHEDHEPDIRAWLARVEKQ